MHPNLLLDVEFNQLWTDIRSILLTFGDDDTELDKIKDGSVFEAPTQAINEENVKEASRLNSLATQACIRMESFLKLLLYISKPQFYRVLLIVIVLFSFPIWLLVV